MADYDIRKCRHQLRLRLAYYISQEVEVCVWSDLNIFFIWSDLDVIYT